MKKVILITGASKGLGKELCKLFLDNNYDVIGTYHNTFSSDTNIDYQKCDLSNENDINNLFNYIKDKYHHLDVLINNAALCQDSDFDHKTSDEFKNVLNVNLIGTFLMIKYFSKIMDKGCIVNISSLDAEDTYSPYSIDYAASKAGVENLTKNIALILSNLKVVALAPAWINTETVLEMEPNYLKEEMIKHNQERLLDKKNVAKKILEIVNSDKYKSGMIIRMEDDNEYR
jgi:3-oxoacyl-[acyl-carrier protein] reductase